MAASIIAVSGLMPARDLNGRAVVATINIYANLTTTPEPVYTTSDLTVPISQPVTSDDAGRFPILWIDSSKTVTMAWATADGQTRTVTGLTGSTAASSALTDDANAALAAIEAIAGDIDGFAENVAAAAASAVAAAASETAAAASATTAAGSVTSAGTQATNAANSATAAGVAQTAAEAARDQAEASAPALLMTFAASTTDADPGAGLLRLNHATLSSVTAAYVDNVDANGNTISGTIDTWDDSTSTDKGTVTFREGATGKVANYSLTGSVVDGTGYRKLTLTWQSGATGGFTAAAAIGITFSRTGNAGADGAGIGDLLASNNLSDLADAATARTNLGLAIGTNVQAYDATLGGLAAVTTAADKLIYATGADTFATTDITSVARTLNGQTTQALMRTAGLGMTANGSSLVSATDYAAMKTLLGLTVGTDVQAYDADLSALAGLTSAADKVPYFTGAGTASTTDLTSVARTLIGQTTQATMRTTGLGMSANGSSLVSAADYPAMAALLGVSGGAVVWLQHVSASAVSAVDIEGFFNGTYQAYRLIGRNLYGGTTLGCRMKIGGAYKSDSGYAFHAANPAVSGASYVGAIGPGTELPIMTINGSIANSAQLVMDIIGDPTLTTTIKTATWSGVAPASAIAFGGGGYVDALTALTGLRFIAPGGSGLLTGEFDLYGIKHSA